MIRPAPEVSVVVPTVDRVALLERCLHGLARQEGAPAYEVLVVHDGDPGVVRLLERLTPQLPLRGQRIAERGVSAKRNAGWRAAAAPLIAFTDDDCEPAPSWLAGLVTAAGPQVELVAGPVLPHPADAAVTGLWRRTVHTPTDAGFYPGCNLLLRRSALERVGGFDPALRAGEDTDLAWRVRESGGGAGWAEAGLVWHAVRAVDFAGQLRSLPRWAGLPLVVRRHPQLRERLGHRRWFWKDSHPAALLALAGLLLFPRDRRALLAVAPLLLRRIRAAGPRAGLALAVNDVAEVAVLAVGSARHRSVLL